MEKRDYLIIGGDSLLGCGIAARLRERGKGFVATSRNKYNLSENNIFLDLSEDVSSWNVPEGIKYAFVCASVTNLEECRINPEESRKVNVDNTFFLASKLAEKGISIVYPSTSQVFDGQAPNRKAQDLVCPNVEYGRQKAAAEEGILKLGKNHSVVRFTKILGTDHPLLTGWINQMKNKRPIRPFSDMFLAPLYIDYAVKVIVAIAEKESYGIWQVSAKEDISYASLALYLGTKMGVEEQYIKPIMVKDSDIKLESITKHTTLDTSRLESELGFARPDVWKTIDTLFGIK